MAQIEDLCTPVTLAFGDVIEFPIRPTADSVSFTWGTRSVVTDVLEDGRVFGASPILERNGEEVLALWGGTMWPPCRKTGEQWDLERIAAALHRGVGRVSVERILEIGESSAEQEPVEYPMGSITRGGIRESDTL